MSSTPRFIHGVFSYEGKGLENPSLIDSSATYRVASDKRAQLVYLRAGNSAAELVYLVLVRDGKPMRFFPVGARASIHVPLVVMEDIFPESKLEVLVGAPKGTLGTVVLDIGMVEVD
ncbi:MAG TPA: molybdopterin oxidoreductase [Polyangiaceae bacterium]